MPTRLPYGLSYVKPGANSQEYTLAIGTQTPSVLMGTYFVNAASALTITNFTGGERGKIIFVRSNSGTFTTIQNSAGGINIAANLVFFNSAGNIATLSATGGNAIMLNREVMPFAHNGTDWDYIGTRAVYSTQV